MKKQVDTVNHSSERDDEDVLESVHALMHQYRAQQYRVLRDGPHDITHMEFKVLGFFGRQPGATQSDLAQHSGRDKAQLARLIKGLRERGLLLAQTDAQDRRNLRLSLSEEGQALQQSLRQRAQRLGAAAVAGLSEQELQTLQALLLRMRRNLDSAD